MLIRALIGSIALAAVTTSAAAQLSLHWQFCTGNPGIDWDTQIKSCTALIQSGTELKENEATAFYNRAVAYENKEKYDLAIADFTAGCGALEALRGIQEAGIDLPLIVVSGKAKDSDVITVLKAGAADHMTRGNEAVAVAFPF